MSSRWAISLGLVGFFVASAPMAQAQIQVFGSGWARDCYVMVKLARVPVTKMIETCTIALDQEKLTVENRVATHVNRGIAHMRMDHESQALADFDYGATMSPDIPEIWINRGAALYRLGRYEEALADLNRGLTSTRKDALAALHYNRAITYEKLGNIELAYADLQRALQIDPELVPAQRRLTRYKVIGES